MDLATFGAILSFAIDIEGQAAQFYETATPLHDQFSNLASVCQKNGKQLERIRRENVAEMILEPITGFESDDYTPDFALPADASPASAAAQAAQVETTFERFYEVAAEKLPIKEVSRRLEKMARQHRQSHVDLTALAAE
jgi:rubrerythrin